MFSKPKERIGSTVYVIGHQRCRPIQLWASPKGASGTSWEHVWGFHGRTVQQPDDKLESIISESGRILELRDNFDGEGSSGYSKATWNRAVEFLKIQWSEYLKREGEAMPAPSILPGPEGSVDIYWEEADFELLVNIPTDPDKLVSFYGDNHGKEKIEGAINPAQPNRGLLSWLARM